MENLYIISDTKDNANNFGTMVLGLNNNQFTAVTGMQDIDLVPNGAIFVDADIHPLDSVQIGEVLVSKGCLDLKDKEYIMEFIYRLYQDIQSVNQLFEPYREAKSTEQGIRQIKNKLSYRGITELNGFQYQVGRHQQGYFYLIPESPRMKVIINLYIGYVNNVIKPQLQTSGFQIGKPVMGL